jgi:Tfp pilus assembly protein PilO
MSGRRRIIVWVIAAFLACVVFYVAAVKPQREELAEVRLEIVEEQARTTQLQAELQRLQALQENAPALQAELEVIRGFVPTNPELSNFIFQVQDAATSAGLDFVEISPELPRTPPEGAALAQVRATIGATGGYFALQDFVRRLYRLDRALRADTISVAVSSLEPFGTRLRMSIATRVFYELPEPPVVVGATPAPTSVPSPAPTVTP